MILCDVDGCCTLDILHVVITRHYYLIISLVKRYNDCIFLKDTMRILFERKTMCQLIYFKLLLESEDL